MMGLPLRSQVAVDSIILSCGRIICGVVALALTLGTAPSLAEAQSDAGPTLADKETARQAFYEGQDAFNAGDIRAALKAFRAADAIMGLPSTRIEVGRTLMQMGRLLESAEKLASVDLIPAEADENDVQRDARAEAHTLLGRVRARIPTLLVTVRGAAPGTEVKLIIDGDAIPAGAMDFPRKVDPGAHVLRVEAAGYREVARKITVAEREQKEVRLDLVAASRGALPEPAPPAPVEPDEGGFEMPVWGWVGFGVGAAGLVVGGVTGALTLAEVGDLEDDCGGTVCPPTDQARIDDATTVAHVSTAGFVLGGVGVAVGVAGIIAGFMADDAPDPEARMTVQPWVGPGLLGLTGRF